MKKNIKEQVTKNTIPEKELQILQSPQFTKTGQLVLLCPDRQGNPTPINVDGKTYFGGTKSGEIYFVYDGFVLKRIGTDGCQFEKLEDANGNVVRYKEVPNQTLSGVYDDKLLQFGINPNDPQTDKLNKVSQINESLKKLVAIGTKSDIFKLWNQIVAYYYPNNPEMQLKTEDGSTLEPPVDINDRDSNYRYKTAGNLGLKFLNKDIVFYYPQNAKTPTSTSKRGKFTLDNCKVALAEYLGNAMAFATNQQTKSDLSVDNNNTREFIKGCRGAGMYDKPFVLTVTDLEPYVQLSKRNTPFKWYRKGETLDFDNINSLLTGKELKQLRPGNSYLPFYADPSMRESVLDLKKVIKENLTKIKREKDSSLLIETKIVKSRTELLTENRILKFKQPREKFFNEIISESMYLNKQGFDKQIIKEEFWDSLKGLFGEHGSNAIFTTFKEYMGKYLVGKLTSINPNGWMGENIKEAINKIHIEDLDKITDCDFISRKISTSITDSIISKVSKGQDIEGGNISSIVKGGLDKSIDRTELTKNIHEGITKLICPVLGDVSKKLKEKGEEMKLNAVRP
jgi:hypothetical protein